MFLKQEKPNDDFEGTKFGSKGKLLLHILLFQNILKKQKISTDELYNVHCVHIPYVFTSCQFWPILGKKGSLHFFL